MIDAHLETRTYRTTLGPAAADGHHVVTGWVARVPVTLNPDQAVGHWGRPVSPARHSNVPRRRRDQTRAFSARGAIDAQVGSAIYEMGAASAILPLMCLGAALTRWRRTR